MSIAAAVITVSDRCSAGTQEDRSGPLAQRLLADAGFAAPAPVVVPDDVAAIQGAIRAAVEAGARVVVTTGGTGVSPRDVTPEATRPLLEAELPGVAENIRAVGRASAPAADLSRGLVGITGRGPTGVVVVNAPGSTGGVRDTLAVVAPLVGHVIDQLAGGGH